MRAALLLILTLLPSCLCLQPPGRGAKADAGYARAEPVIQALEKFERETHGWPATLAELVPTYFAAIPQADSLEYKRTTTSFELRFHYSPPGMNTCVYTPESKWQCSGYY